MTCNKQHQIINSHAQRIIDFGHAQDIINQLFNSNQKLAIKDLDLDFNYSVCK